MGPAEDRLDLDLNNVTVAELEGLDNPVLKRVLLQVKKQMEQEAAGTPEATEFCLHEVFYNYTS